MQRLVNKRLMTEEFAAYCARCGVDGQELFSWQPQHADQLAVEYGATIRSVLPELDQLKAVRYPRPPPLNAANVQIGSVSGSIAIGYLSLTISSPDLDLPPSVPQRIKLNKTKRIASLGLGAL